MMKRLASDLSPAQTLINQISCQSCQYFVIEAHFRQAIKTVETQVSLQDWQKKRLFALLSPMYLEAKLMILDTYSQKSNYTNVTVKELLLEHQLSGLSAQSVCTHHGAIQLGDPLLCEALTNLKKVFNEVLGENIF